MILLQVSDGTTTKYFCDIQSRLVNGESHGYELDGQFYEPGIRNQTNINLSLNGNFGSINQSYIRIKRDLVNTLTKDELTADVWLWDEKTASSKFKVFSGVIALREKNSVEYTYQIKQNNGNLDADLLSAAPDLKQVDTESSTFNDGRVYPYMFGYIKYATPLLLAVTCATGCGGQYHSDGETTAMYDGGQDVNYSQSGTTATKTGTSPVYEITTDINSTSASSGSATTNPDLTITNRTIYDTTAPTTTDYTLYQGDIWVKTDTEESFVWNGSNWNQQAADSTAPAINRNIIVNTSGGGIRAGKSSVNDTTNAGWALELDGTDAEMFLSNAGFTKGIRWDGSTLTLRGTQATDGIGIFRDDPSTPDVMTIVGGYVKLGSIGTRIIAETDIEKDGSLSIYEWSTLAAAWSRSISLNNTDVSNLKSNFTNQTNNATAIKGSDLATSGGKAIQGISTHNIGGEFQGGASDIRLIGSASAPSGAIAGAIYYNTTDKKLYLHDGAGWRIIFSAESDGSLKVN